MMAENARTAEKRFGMLIDLAACVGCNACVVACKQENDLPVENFNTWIESWDAGRYPHTKRANLPKLCNHCTDAPCVSVCPTGASHVAEGGMVLIDESKCIGCRYCMAACPFQVRWQSDASGAVQKCTFCFERAQAGLLPACAGNCPTGARLFGDMNDPASEIAQRIGQMETEGLLPELGIGTHVRYIGLTRLMEQPVTSAVFHGGRVVVPYEGEGEVI